MERAREQMSVASAGPKPDWLKTRLPAGEGFEQVNEVLRRLRLNTVCSAARCPNLHACWRSRTATFMILGDICTRSCRFCAVRSGNPEGVVDITEPARIAEAVRALGIGHVVITSVDRDDLADFGAGLFAATVKAVREQARRVEVLTPDFEGRDDLVQMVAEAGPHLFGHNVETVERLTPAVRDRRASYQQSLRLLSRIKRCFSGLWVKSGLMVGLGETDDEVLLTLADLRSAGVDIVTIGQYLQPARRCLPVQRYVRPEKFAEYEARARELGFRGVFCGPLVRSSYRAAEVYEHGG